jgi:hypothetical protein
MGTITRRMIFGAGVFLLAGALTPAARGQEYSHARIVRLSFVEGAVAVQRPDVDEWAAALVNTPIQEGFQVSTAEDGFAEVEFENASTARLGQFSLLEFAQLVLAPSGGKINRLRLHQGYATFNFIPEDDDYYEVTAGDATFLPHGKSRFRLDMQDDLLLVKVFKGSVEITSPEGSGTVGEDAMLELRRGGDPAFQITQGVTKDEWDEWVDKREGHVELVRNQGLAPAPGVYSNDATSLLYGFADLASYGQWVVLPGYGSAWAPNVGAGWAPYSYGRWCWYPSYGYTWISSEPWGWMPYHFGQWVYQPGYGWCWIPVNLTAWSPALVNWYRGPGWVGWSPAGSPRLGGGSAACQSPEGCATAVSDNTFRDGGSVNPVRIHGINPTVDGRQVGSPDITPGRRGWLPGEPYRLATNPGATQGLGQGSVPSGGRISVYPPQSGSSADSPAGRRLSTTTSVEPGVRTRTSSGGIVFDPEQRQYINAGEPPKSTSPALTIQPTSAGEESKAPTAPSATPSAPAAARESRPVGSLVGAHRPSPQGNYPSRIIAPPPERGAGTGNSISVFPGGRSGDGAGSSGSSSVGRQAAGSSSRTSKTSGSSISSGGNRSAGSGVSVRSSGGSSVSSGGSRGSMGGGAAGGGSRGSVGGSSGGGSRPSSSGRPPRR